MITKQHLFLFSLIFLTKAISDDAQSEVKKPTVKRKKQRQKQNQDPYVVFNKAWEEYAKKELPWLTDVDQENNKKRQKQA